jgi:hypothetical protein
MEFGDGSKGLCNRIIVANSEATATTAGITDCTAAKIAMSKLCLNRTGWVISYP